MSSVPFEKRLSYPQVVFMPTHRIVVADDSEVFRTALCGLLRQVLNTTVIATAQDGVEALRLVAEMKPDLLILDINMPQMDGWEVLGQLHNMTSSMNTLVLTAHANPALSRRALDNGADAWVSKGNIPLLIDTLHQLLPDEQMGA